MGGNNSAGKKDNFPLAGDITLPVYMTIAVTILMVVASIGSLLFPESIYSSDEQRAAFLTNDVVNLLVGVPMMLITISMARRRKLLSLVIWPGALIYVIYNYLAYIFGMPLSWVTGLNAALVILGLAAGVILILRMDLVGLSEALAGSGPRVTASVVMVVFGAGFFVQAAQKVFGFAAGSGEIARADFGVFTADLVVSVIWIAGGLLLMQRKPLGYPLGWGGMFGVVMLNVGLLTFLVLQPVLTEVPFSLVDVIVIAVFTIVCALPWILFLRDLRK